MIFSVTNGQGIARHLKYFSDFNLKNRTVVLKCEDYQSATT